MQIAESQCKDIISSLNTVQKKQNPKILVGRHRHEYSVSQNNIMLIHKIHNACMHA